MANGPLLLPPLPARRRQATAVWLKSATALTDSTVTALSGRKLPQAARDPLTHACSGPGGLMTQDVVRRCPHCGKRASQALLPCPGGEGGQFKPEDACAAVSRRYYCLQCRAIWQSLELPAAQWEAALARADLVEELQRQVAMLRFLLASLRQQQEQAPLAVADAPRRLASGAANPSL